MKYSRFEELPVWNAAIEFAVKVYSFTTNRAFERKYSVKDQLERASVSISTNTAEGFERGTTQELLTFIYIARGSAGEVRSILCFLERLPDFGGLKSEILNLKSSVEGISRQLGAWATSLQNSKIKGIRYLDAKTKKLEQAKQQRDEFLAELRSTNEKNLREMELARKKN